MIAIKNAKQEVIRDTVVKLDTLKIEVPGKPIPGPIQYVPVNIADLDSITIAAMLEDYLAVKTYTDVQDFADAGVKFTVHDSLQCNDILSRRFELDVYKRDTTYIERVNHIKEPAQQVYMPRNHIDFGYAYANSKLSSYELSYMRQFGKGKVQYKIGAGAGIISNRLQGTTDNTAFAQIRLGLAF